MNLDETDSPLVHRTGPRPVDADLLNRLRQVQETLPPGTAFSHSTAAEILGWPAPWTARVTGDIHTMCVTGGRRLRRSGIVSHQGLERRTVTTVHGLQVVAHAHTFVDLGQLVCTSGSYDYEDIIIACDNALTDGCTRTQLRGIILERVKGARGVRSLLPALDWSRRGSESAPETRFRLVMHRAGLPIPELNRNVYDSAGTFLFRNDYGWRVRRVAAEMQSAQYHDNPDAVVRDGRRLGRGEEHGWWIFEARGQHIWVKEDRDDALCEIADALQFPQSRIDFAAAEPQRHSPQALATLLENQERRRRRGRAQWLGSGGQCW